MAQSTEATANRAQVPGGEAVSAPAQRTPRDPLARPASTEQIRVRWSVAAFLGGIHVVALLAVWPALFSWSGLALMVIGSYLFGCLGINICYHRLLTHRSFTTPRWFERILTLLGFCNLEGSSIRWVAAHRVHHQHSDHQPDPHSPLVSFLWSHMLWLVIENPDVDSDESLDRFAADLRRDRFHASMDRAYRWLAVWALHVLLVGAAGFAWGLIFAPTTAAALMAAASWVVWGVFVRTVVVWHVTWSINSITHLWGYKNYQTTDDSRNNWLLGIIGMGEGWHNNHHADQRSAAHGHRWWEFDLSYMTIRVFRLFGLARKVVVPKRNRGTTHDLAAKRLAPAPVVVAAEPEPEPESIMAQVK